MNLSSFTLLMNIFFLFSSFTCAYEKPGLFEHAFCSLSEFFVGRECCRSARVNFRFDEFHAGIQAKLFGQSGAADEVGRAVSRHWRSDHQPKKALVLMLHGPPGVGKTYITELLAEYSFLKGKFSQFYHFFSALKDFPHKEEIFTYSEQIRSWVSGNVSYCERSLFVFDEVDQMPTRLIDTLKPYMDYGSVINRVDYRRSIFVLLSNIGSETIVEEMVQWKAKGQDRDSFPIEELGKKILQDAFTSDQSTIKESYLIKKQLISQFIPFLPLERTHVLKCIKSYLVESKNAHLCEDKRFLLNVLNQVEFKPRKEYFSTNGCKGVPDFVAKSLHKWETRQLSGSGSDLEVKFDDEL